MNQKSEPKYTNNLIDETSPYLLQHAHNPVNWYPWTEVALNLAKSQDKPILLSIGYAACHWCHVMAHESFEDEETAVLMNEYFVCIKVDREERPDLDQIYMTFVQMTTGSGGWPLTVFLTPDHLPFYGGTYFPPEDRFGRPSWKKILQRIHEYYQQDQAHLQQNINLIRDALGQSTFRMKDVQDLDFTLIQEAAKKLSDLYDPLHGGLGHAPKFPAVQGLSFFLREYKRSGNKHYLEMVTRSLRTMARGGIYDQLAGGFARYSVDDRWLVPHFEKMLYDNAQLVTLYLDTFLITRDDFFINVVRDTLDFVYEELRSEQGGFYSSLDADSEGVEGKYYLWNKQEIDHILGDKSPVFCEYYEVTARGNFEGKNILHVQTNLEALAGRFDLSVEETEKLLSNCRQLLKNTRRKRIRPVRDEKILTSWNALMVSAYASAYQVLREDRYRQIIVDNINFIRNNLFKDGGILRVYSKGQAKYKGYLDDHAFLIKALFDAYEALFDIRYLEWAKELLDYVNLHFWDEQSSSYFYTSDEQSGLILRMKDEYDQSIPSGTGIMILNNLRFYSVMEDSGLWQRSENVLRTFGREMRENPLAYGSYLLALDFYLTKPKEIVLVLPDRILPEHFYKKIFNIFLPNKIVLQLFPGHHSPLLKASLFQGKQAINKRTTVYVCHNFSCSEPVLIAEDLERLLI